MYHHITLVYLTQNNFL